LSQEAPASEKHLQETEPGTDRIRQELSDAAGATISGAKRRRRAGADETGRDGTRGHLRGGGGRGSPLLRWRAAASPRRGLERLSRGRGERREAKFSAPSWAGWFRF